MNIRIAHRYLVPMLLIALAAPSLACGDDVDVDDTGTSPATATATTGASETAAATITVTATAVSTTPATTADADVCQPNPDPATADVTDVELPEAGDEIESPVTVAGDIIAFEATFKLTLYDADGDEIADMTAMSAEGQTFAPFEAELPFEVLEETPACLWVYEASAMDGSPIHVVQIPLVLLPSS